METGDPIEDYPEYMRNAVNDICNGDFATKIIGFVNCDDRNRYIPYYHNY